MSSTGAELTSDYMINKRLSWRDTVNLGVANVKTTMADVAEAVGVSLKTVDRVINGRGGVEPGLEQRVLAEARRQNLDRALAIRPTRILRLQILMPDPAQNSYFSDLHKAFLHANEVYRLHNVACGFHFYDVRRPNDLVEIIGEASAHADFLVVVAPNQVQIVDAINEAAKTTKVITLNTDLPASRRWQYIGADDLAAGRVAGELMGRFLGPSGGDVLLVAGLLSMLGQEEREKGFRAVTQARFNNCRIVEVIESHDQKDQIKSLVAEALYKNPQITGIYHTTFGSVQLAQALSYAGRSDMVVITHELTPERRDLLINGEIDAVIDQDRHGQAVAVMEACLAEFGRLGQTKAPMRTPISIHLRENIS